ncbi:MAG: PHP domain-containing protein, partial [Fusobacteriaceae bacterium]
MLMLKKKKCIVLFNQLKKEIEVRVTKSNDITEELQLEINKLRATHSDYFFTLTINDKYKVDNLDINDISKFKNHINQNVKLLLKIVKVEEKKTRNGKFLYVIEGELPGKKKVAKCKMFSESIIAIKENCFYIVSAKIEIADSRYMKKNEIALGKAIDFSVNIFNMEEYRDVVNLEENKYTKPRQELHAHTMFSKNDGFITQNDMRIAFLENKVDQIAITDHGAVFGFLPFLNELKNEFKDSGKRLILGSEFYTVDTTEYDSKTNLQ